jgi:hypothetical protein
VAENHLDLAGDQFEQVDLVVEQAEDALLDAAREAEVEDVHLTCLADAVHAADALLDRHRVPGEIVVDHRPAELEIAALAADLTRQQHLRVPLERRDRGVFLDCRQAAVKHGHAKPRLDEHTLEFVERSRSSA